jgi:hypothetical protein
MLAICIVIGAPAGYAQDFRDGPADIFAGCETDTRAPSDGASPRERIERQATPKIDKVTQRAFASFSMEFIRPQLGVSRASMEKQLPADDAFLLNYHLDNMSASRRGYDIIHQDPFFLMHNPKFEIFAKVDPRNYDITEKRTVPVGFILVKEDGQGTVYRKSLMTSEREIQETNAHAFGARLQGSGAPLGVPVSAAAGFETAKSTMSSMANSSSVAEAVGYSRTKKYALVVDHPYITAKGQPL